MVGREVGDIEREEGADIREPSLLRLTRQAVDEIQAEIVDAMTAQSFDSSEDLLSAMTAVEER